MKKKINSRVLAIVIITILDIAYQILPVDAIPDIAPVVGQIDDSIVVLINVLTTVRLLTARNKAIESE